ncbi:MAG: response regulator [Bacteroidota bacterium]
MYKNKFALVVEDDPGMRQLAQIVLLNLGKFEKIETSSNGLEALESIKCNGLPDYIFLDIAMPIMNGIEFLEEIQKIYCDKNFKTRIVILSSYDSQDYKQDVCRFRNVTDYVLKPLTIEKAIKVII